MNPSQVPSCRPHAAASRPRPRGACRAALLVSLAAGVVGPAASLADRICFDLRGVAAGPSRGGIGCGGDNVITDIPAGTTACAALANWKANWDATPGNASGPVTQRPDGTCDWCVTQVRGEKPGPGTGGIIGYTAPGFNDLSVRRVKNPPPAPPPPPAKIKITIVLQVAAGGGIQITIEIEIAGVVQSMPMQIPTFPGMSPHQLNSQIQQVLQSRGFQVEMDVADFPDRGLLPVLSIVGHDSGGTLLGAEVRYNDPALTDWGIAYEPEAVPDCPGDINGDGLVDLNDLTTLLAHFGMPFGATLADGDLDADGDVDLGDLTTMLSNFGTVCQ